MLGSAFLALLSLATARAQAVHVEGRMLSGTIALAVGDDAPRTPATGSIQFWIGGRGGEIVEAGVRDGVFRVSLPYQEEWIDVGPVELDGVACWSIPSWPDDARPDVVALVARPVKPAFVRFVESETGADVPRVTLTQPGDEPGEPDVVVLADAASPIEVPRFGGRDDVPRGWIGLREYAVTAPGRALRRVWIDPSEGGLRTFDLAAEARLEVRAPLGKSEVDRYEVRLERDGRHPRWPAQRIQPDGVVRIGGLPAGTWRVWMAEASSPPEYGFRRAEVVLRAGSARRVDVGWTHAGVSRSVSELRGTLRLPDGVDPASVALSFRPARWREGWDPPPRGRDLRSPHDVTGDILVADPRDPRLLHWFAGSVESGTWWISIGSLRWSERFEVEHDQLVEVVVDPPRADPPATSAADAAEVAPTPAVNGPIEVEARFVDGPSARELGPREIEVWIESRDKWSVHCAVDETRWRLRAPVGRFRVFVLRAGESAAPREFAVEATAGDRSFVLWPAQRIEVRAYDGDARIGAPEVVEELGLVVEPVGHDGKAQLPGATTQRANVAHVDVVGPGRYRIALRSNGPYAPHRQVEVEVGAGEMPIVATFRLKRARR